MLYFTDPDVSVEEGKKRAAQALREAMERLAPAIRPSPSQQ